MKRKQEVHKKFLKYSIPEKLILGAKVYDQLNTENTLFHSPPFALKSLSDATTALSNAAVAARSGNHALVSVMHDAEHDWDVAFNRAAAYINAVADGSQTIIEQGGFTATKDSATDSDLPDVPEGVDIYANRGAGSIHAECDSAGPMHFYSMIAVPVGSVVEDIAGMIRVTPPSGSSSGPTYTFSSRYRRIDLTGLTSGQQITVYMYISNTAGTGPLSHGVTMYVP